MTLQKIGKPYNCSFCGTSAEEAGELIRGEKVHAHICTDCADEVQLIFLETNGEGSQNKFSSMRSKDIKARQKQNRGEEDEFGDTLSPMEIKDKLDRYVIGQEEAKRAIAIGIYNHFKRTYHNYNLSDEQTEIEKSNIVLIGPTGSGKTLVAKTIAKICGLPFVAVDATTMTEAGYVGDDVDFMIQLLLIEAEGVKEVAEQGIIYIDEIDKIAMLFEGDKDVGGQSVQQALLKILEGTIVAVPDTHVRKNRADKLIEVDTKNILFIVGGAFDGIETIIAKRKNQKTFGFATDSKSSKQISLFDIAGRDIINFGFIPEFVGRIPILTVLEKLTEEELLRILIEPKNAITKQYKTLFGLSGIDLQFTDEALREIASMAIKEKEGARSLRSMLEKVMKDAMYEVPSLRNVQKCIINKETVETGRYGIINAEQELICHK